MDLTALYRLPQGNVALVLTALGVLSVFSLGYAFLALHEAGSLLEDSANAQAPAMPADEAKATVNPEYFDTRVLRETELFGAPELAVEELDYVAELPATTLPLTLKGVFTYGSDNADARALIASQGQEGAYRISDEVTGGRQVVAILPDAVILRSAEGIEKLGFEEQQSIVQPNLAITSAATDVQDRGGPEVADTPTARYIPPSPTERPSLRERLRRK